MKKENKIITLLEKVVLQEPGYEDVLHEVIELIRHAEKEPIETFKFFGEYKLEG